MRKIFAFFLILAMSCGKIDDMPGTGSSGISGSNGGSTSGDTPCGYHNGKRLYKGPQGGCYYINSNGNKTYVDRSECRC